MKNFIKNNLLTIILIALLLIGGNMLYNKINSLHRLQDNNEQLLKNFNSKILKLTKKEFKQMQKQYTDTLLQQLMDSMDLNYRHITKTINQHYTYTYDTTITHLYPKSKGIKTFYKKFDNCLSVSGEVDWDKDLLTFNDAKTDYSQTSAYYWKRKHKFLKIQFGRKVNYMITKNSCKGTTTVKEIDIVKNNK